MTTREKALAARITCDSWERDWGGIANASEPTASQLIRATALSGWYGHTRSLAEVYQLPMSGGWIRTQRPAEVREHDSGRSGYGSQSMNVLPKANRLSQRYRQFCDYMREVRHGWQHVHTFHYADNSIAVSERSALTGEIRERMTVAPGGDLCF